MTAVQVATDGSSEKRAAMPQYPNSPESVVFQTFASHTYVAFVAVVSDSPETESTVQLSSFILNHLGL